ncbi:hypothetical protein [Psychroflexus salis]|uniref:Uncharacterized protein n=1 Tax=Psychroflexus salis TaxID=1526574 RepID=A0A917E8C9_9FLAO|nr:hypothetical protein [Psychroflexus salis]GGE09260.1 hypothetical protein GCM10010831_08530 [Psychroflexus salis]
MLFIIACTKDDGLKDINKNVPITSEDRCLDDDSNDDPYNPNHPPEPDYPPYSYSVNTRPDLHRFFRDTILIQNNGYRKYVDYYYIVSDEIDYDSLNINAKVKIWDVALKLDEPILNALNPNYNGVLLNHELKSDILELSDILREYSQNESIFDEFQNDLNHIVGKTKSEILR